MFSNIHQEFEAPEELKDTVRCFWYNRRYYDEERSEFTVFPDGYAEIIFHFGGGCSIFHHGILQELHSPFIMGLLNQPAVFHAQHQLEIIGIRCFPWAVFDLLGLSSEKTENGVHSFEHPLAKLQSVLNDLITQAKVEEAISEVEQYFLTLHSYSTTDSLLSKAGAAMRENKGAIRVSQIADSAHTTVRTLERKFKQSSGHTVKDVSGIMRFEQVRNRLWNTPEASIAELAQEFGYTDQSHLSREFKRYSGITPAVFARESKKRKEALRNDFVAFVQA
ncbi:helix-turn-helix domain-containing protein [Chryseobacterium aureum]|uniref:helix-turn-helix domain-containing protein n=1 Tax=Chryseobacterium aureum TaxID=2497456 RepID=UPI000F8644B4|nr:helix-turn-helix domain-containing protein [Chryseobacterium aureum]